jgi:adenine-specific DNA-methyltransferase
VKGFVPTPSVIVDVMVAKLFAGRTVSASSSILDPGCGDGEFIAGILRFVEAKRTVPPRIVGIELDPGRASAARARFASNDNVTIECADFLAPQVRQFDYVIGNPPYVSIGGLSVAERTQFRSTFVTAKGRFDLYSLFFEQSLRLLHPDGRLVFITPEKFTYVETAKPLRELLSRRGVVELHYCQEDAFAGYVTYPVITTVSGGAASSPSQIRHRSGLHTTAVLPFSASWMSAISGFGGPADSSAATLNDYALRISCGVATGADGVFVIPGGSLTASLLPFAFPTISGRQIQPNLALGNATSFLLAPYDSSGRLLPESQLGGLGVYLKDPSRRRLLEVRTCVARKPWYAYHDSFPIGDMLRPKLLTKDIGAEPVFVADHEGSIVPRHSVYYIVPRDPADLDTIERYVNSTEARAWLSANCQRAANGFLRVQSHVLKQLPIPMHVAALLNGRQDAHDLAALLPA